MIKIEKWSNGVTDQKFFEGGKCWLVSTLIYKSKDLPVQVMPLEHLNIYNLCPEIKTMQDFVAHMKSILDADLTKPIILDDEGYVMDGRHRIARALLEGKETIKFVRFEETPDYDYTENKKSEG